MGNEDIYQQKRDLHAWNERAVQSTRATEGTAVQRELLTKCESRIAFLCQLLPRTVRKLR